MFRVFSRAALISSYQSLLLPSVAPCAFAASVTITPSSYVGGREVRVASPFAPKLFYEQVRHFWGKEGRIGWRRRRSMERARRLKILEPNTPVIDQEFPLPRDNKDKIPPGLFDEEREEELSPEEERNAQNAILGRINQQVKGNSEGRLFAVIHINGKQFKVTPEDIITVQRSFLPTVGDQIRLQKVLLVGGKDFTLVGSPLLDQDLVRVEATVVEKTMSYTKITFLMQKRKNYRRYKFMKVEHAMLRINLIELMQPLEAITSDTHRFSQQQEQFL